MPVPIAAYDANRPGDGDSYLPDRWIIEVPGFEDALRRLREGLITPDQFHFIVRVPGVIDHQACNRLAFFTALPELDRRRYFDGYLVRRWLLRYFNGNGTRFVVSNRDSLRRLCRTVFFPVPGSHLTFLDGMITGQPVKPPTNARPGPWKIDLDPRARRRPREIEQDPQARHGPWEIELAWPYPFCFQPSRTRLSFGLTIALALQIAAPWFKEQLPTLTSLGIDSCDTVGSHLKIFKHPVVYCDAYVTLFQDARHARDEHSPIYQYAAPYRHPVCTNCLAFSAGQCCQVRWKAWYLIHSAWWVGDVVRQRLENLLDRPEEEDPEDQDDQGAQGSPEDIVTSWPSMDEL